MKKLTIEQKAKAYDEALKVAKDIRDGKATYISNGTTVIEAIFPELKEDENERIRKKLISYFSDVKGFSTLEYNYGVTNEEVVAWLEKQGNTAYNEELSKLLHKVICKFINHPDFPYAEREEASVKVLPYIERLEKLI